MRTAQIDFSMYQDFPAIVIPFIFEIDIMIKFDFRKQRVHVQMLFTFSFQKCWSNSSNYNWFQELAPQRSVIKSW